MSATLGSFIFDLWEGPPPPRVKSQVDLVFRPGQATAAAKILPNQSTRGEFSGRVYAPTFAQANTDADAYRAAIGTQLALVWGGISYGNVLIEAVTVSDIQVVSFVSGRHPVAPPGSGFTPFTYSGGARVDSRWSVVRLS